MPVYDNATIARFAADGEQNFNIARPCIVDRLSLDIVSGTALYTLPSYILAIRRVAWRGWKLYPLPHRDLRKSFQAGTQQSRPYWYIFNNVGQGKIQLFPVPNETVASITTNLWGSEILNRVVVEYFRTPDADLDFTIPDFIRRRLLKCFVGQKTFQADTKAGSNKAAKYWAQKFDFLTQTYTDLLDDLNNKPRNIVASGSQSRPYGFIPPPPVLPIAQFGVAVDDITG